MKKKIITAVAIICAAGSILYGTVLAQSAATKPTITKFAAVAATVEKNYGALLEMELTIRKGEPVYKADVISGGKLVRVYLNAVTGKEIQRNVAVDLDDDERAIYNSYKFAAAASGAGTQKAPAPTPKGGASAAKITNEKAREIALAKVGGGTVKEIELDHDGGLLVYEIEIRHNNQEHEIKIDANTGEIIRYKVDD